MCIAGTPLHPGMYTPLSEPAEVWHFDLRSPPEDSAERTLDLAISRPGVLNAVVFWFKLHLIDGIELSSGPSAVAAGARRVRVRVRDSGPVETVRHSGLATKWPACGFVVEAAPGHARGCGKQRVAAHARAFIDWRMQMVQAMLRSCIQPANLQHIA